MNKKTVIPFICKKNTKSAKKEDSSILEQGDFGSLKYTVYKRGVIHITDGKLTFKKDPDIFQDFVRNTNFSKSKKVTIPGSGDNADLILTSNGDDFKATLNKKEFKLISKMKDIIKKGLCAKRS